MTEKELYRTLGRIGRGRFASVEPYLEKMTGLLHDGDDKVRMEAPEMFRVMGKHRPHMVVPYFPILQELSENDPNPVVRIHSAGAIRITNSQLK